MSLFASSSSSGSSSVEYEVFISFRGSDTRYAFTSHLYEALSQKKIVTFIDYKIPGGYGISSALLDAIKKSKAAVVIFSKDYASSPWCLDELVEILEWKKIVIPVFYNVNPTDVEEQTESYAKSFAVHKANGIHDKTLQNWKKALKEASYHKGYVTADIRDEALLTKRIVDDIWKELRVTYKTVNKNLVGIESKVEEIISLLKMGSDDICVVGIWGIGGIGKTTLASAVFNEIRTQFEGSCFLSNIREESEKDVERLRQRLYFDISGVESGNIVDTVRLNLLLSRKKVLIVFDDVTDFEQIENLVGEVNESNRESRFIITTRDRRVLRNCHCKEENIYEVNGLCAQEALQLFSRFAFKQEYPLEDYTEVSRKMVDHAKGSPLALKVLGCLSCKSKLEWESAIEKLKRVPNQKIQGMLKVSYDGLDDEQKKVFLDVACCCKGEHRKDIANCYTYPIEDTLRVLIDRCLVSVDLLGGITMHDLLQEMGRQIVLEESIEDPGKRSRLWHHGDIYQVLTGKEGTRTIKGISFDMSKTTEIRLNKNSFNKMSELCFLNIYNSKKKLSCSKNFQCPSTKLRFLRWEHYPMKSLQSSFSLDNLVILRMSQSKVKQLWNGRQPLPNLKEIYFANSRDLTAIPDLLLAPKLEQINLYGCRNLISLPPCDHLKSLWKLNLVNCNKLVAMPELSCNIRELDPYMTAMTCLPSSIGNLSQLRSLNLSHCHQLSYIPEEFGNLTSIQFLDVSFSPCAVDSVCSHLLGFSNLTTLDLGYCDIVEVPDSICQISSLEELTLSGNYFDKLPENIKRLSTLQELVLDYCAQLQFLPELPRSLKHLFAAGCSSLKAVPYSMSTLMATTTWVSFSRCHMLDKDAFTTIIQDALLEIRRFREHPAQAIEEDEDGSICMDLSYIQYPGCEIPEIFEFQHLGSMISKELPHDMIGGKIVGYAFFFVFKLQQLIERGRGCIPDINFHCKATFENGECFLRRHNFVFYCDESDDTISEAEYEVVVGYTPMSYHRIFPSQYKSTLLELEFSFNADSYYEVERCGFHLFSEEERKGTSSSSSEEKQLERSPKRLKIS